MLALLLSSSLMSCFPSNILAPSQRQVILDSESIEWSNAERHEIVGLHSSTEINGPMAKVLRSIIYLFEEDGSYTAAALFYGPPAEFRVLSGTWKLDGTLLQLDDASPAEAQTSPTGLRISGSEGSVILEHN